MYIVSYQISQGNFIWWCMLNPTFSFSIFFRNFSSSRLSGKKWYAHKSCWSIHIKFRMQVSIGDRYLFPKSIFLPFLRCISFHTKFRKQVSFDNGYIFNPTAATRKGGLGRSPSGGAWGGRAPPPSKKIILICLLSDCEINIVRTYIEWPRHLVQKVKWMGIFNSHTGANNKLLTDSSQIWYAYIFGQYLSIAANIFSKSIMCGHF